MRNSKLSREEFVVANQSQPSLATIWQFISDTLRQDLSPTSFATWVETATPESFTDNVLTITVPTRFHADFWRDTLAEKVSALLKKSTKDTITILAQVPEDANPLSQTVTHDAGQSHKNIDQTGTSNDFDQVPAYMKPSSLNDHYTFENFVVGEGNRMAQAAALSVAEQPGSMYNPLLIYGGVGLGKTHLMQAIGHRMLEINPNYTIRFVSSETFTNDFIDSIRNNRQAEFRDAYRNVDLLLIDDIQFFADKDSTKEEFFHTFEDLFEKNKQIVFTSDRQPEQIPNLEDRLVSRFKMGLSVDITPPDLETRIAILRNKADDNHVSATDDALKYIANNQADKSVRDLQGALNRVIAYSRLNNKPITTDLAAQALQNYNTQVTRPELSIALIQEKVAAHFHVTVDDLKGRKRVKTIVVPRQIAMYLSRTMTDASLPRIGNEFGGKDHTTVIHAYDKIDAALKEDASLRQTVADIKAALQK